jgi:hypothetical protein
MADVEKLFSDYVTEHRAGGEANPRIYLEQVEGTDRRELAELIDGYLVRSPGQVWSAEGYEGSSAQRWVAGMERSMGGEAGLWPILLPRLRERAQITRARLVELLASALGVTGETEKVASYYHRMEQGQLDSTGVSTRVLDALAGIVGSSADALRNAGEQFGEGQPPSEGTVFARTTGPPPQMYVKHDEEPPGAAAMAAERAPEPDAGPDEVDRLFTGGD